MPTSEHFSAEELRCHGNGCCDGGVDKISPRLLELLEQLRSDTGGLPLEISCAYRCPIHNAEIPGSAKFSQHMYGTAADVICPDHLEFGEFLWYVEQLPFDGVGVYEDDGFIHVDVRNGGVGGPGDHIYF